MNRNSLGARIACRLQRSLNENGRLESKNVKIPSNPWTLYSSNVSLYTIMRIYFLLICCICLLDAQIIYDSPPLGVSLTRPILPWLARYFVNAGNSKVYFLDDPQRGPLEKKEDEGGGNGNGDDKGSARSEGGAQDNANGNAGMQGGGGKEQPPQNFPFKTVQLNDQQKAQLDQLQYMVPVPVPVLSAPLFSTAGFSPPMAPSLDSVMAAPLPAFPPPPPINQQLFPVPAPAPIAIGGRFPGVSAPIPSVATTMPSAPSPPQNPPAMPIMPPPIPLPPMPLPIPIAAPFIAAPPAPFVPPPEPLPILADSISLPAIPALIPSATDPLLISAPPPPESIQPPLLIPEPAPIAIQQAPPPPPLSPLQAFPTIAPIPVLMMSGSPAPLDSKFSYRDAVLKGAHAPAPAQPPSKTARTVLTTAMRRFPG